MLIFISKLGVSLFVSIHHRYNELRFGRFRSEKNRNQYDVAVQPLKLQMHNVVVDMEQRQSMFIQFQFRFHALRVRMCNAKNKGF